MDLINVDIKFIDNVPFYNYTDGTFTLNQNTNFNYIKNYSRGQSGLDNFINKFNEKWKEYIHIYNTILSRDISNSEITKIYNELISIFNEFISSFNDNKNHIDNDKDINDEYIWSGGRTELNIFFTVSVIANKNIRTPITKKRQIKINNNYEIEINYKLQKINLKSERW